MNMNYDKKKQIIWMFSISLFKAARFLGCFRGCRIKRKGLISLILSYISRPITGLLV